MKVLAIAWVVLLDWLRRKDAYVFLAIQAALLVLLTSIDFFGIRGAARFALDIGLLLAWVFGWLLALNAGSREFPLEESRGTVFLLLAKPVGRGALVAGKWLGAWIAVSLAVLASYLATALLVGLQGVAFDAAVFVQAFAAHALALAVLTALALLCGTRLTRDAAATFAGVLSIACFAIVPRIPAWIAAARGWRATAMLALYYLLPHLEFFDLRRRLVHGFGPLDAATFATLVLYAGVVTAALLAAAWLAYRRKRFARDRLAES